MKLLLAVLALIFSFSAHAGYKIVSLYEKDALVTGRFLPFKVYDDSNKALGIAGVAPSELCYGMVDQHRDNIFHIYCREQTMAGAKIILKNGDVVTVANLPIRKLSIIEPDLPIEDGGEQTPLQLGEKLFLNNCIGCHRTIPIKSQQSTNSLLNTQFKKSEMKQFGVDPSTKKGFFTDKELEGLVQYINEVIL